MSDPYVAVIGGAELCHESKVTMHMRPATEPPYMFVLMKGEPLPAPNAPHIQIAESASPRLLSKWAFNNGALQVSHDYDLRLSPDK